MNFTNYVKSTKFKFFLNIFLRLQNEIQIADEQTINQLYEKFNDEIKIQLISFSKKKISQFDSTFTKNEFQLKNIC